jgi:hypothetical protein
MRGIVDTGSEHFRRSVTARTRMNYQRVERNQSGLNTCNFASRQHQLWIGIGQREAATASS